MSFVGALNFHTKFIEYLHFNIKTFYDLSYDTTAWNWTDEQERLFQTIKTSLTSEKKLTIPITKRPFFIYYSRCITYWIRRCPFPTQWSQLNESKVLQLSYFKSTMIETIHT